jgi:hypothetical protein
MRQWYRCNKDKTQQIKLSMRFYTALCVCLRIFLRSRALAGLPGGQVVRSPIQFTP